MKPPSARKTTGRPPIAEQRRSVTVTVTITQLAIAERLGNGNISAGIRVALETQKEK